MNGVVIIGCGLIGNKRAHALPDAMHVVSCFDPDEVRAKELAESFDQKVVVAASVEEACAHPDAILAIIATPHNMLTECGMTAIEHGLHVLLEKPGSTNSKSLEDLRDAAQQSQKKVRVGFNHRFHPSIRKAADLLRQKNYGPIMHIRARYGHGGRIGYDKEWRSNKEIAGGGELIDQGIHLIDLTRVFGGDITLAFAELRTDFWDMEVEDNAFLAARITGGGFAWLHATWTEWKNLFSYEIALRDAKIEINGLGGSYGTELLTLHEMKPEMGPPDSQEWEWTAPDSSWEAEMQDVLASLGGRPTIGATIDDAIAAMKIVEEAYAQ